MRPKLTLVLPLLAIFVVTLACSRTTGSESNPDKQATKTPEPSGPCYNILFPFAQGAQWIYETKTEDTSGDPSRIGLTVEKVEGSFATISALDISTGVISQTLAECDNGSILNYPAFTQKMLLGNAVASDFSLEYVSGVFAPAESAFTNNDWLYEWETEFIVSGTIDVDDQGEQMQIILQNSPVHFTWRTAGAGEAAFDAVTVPAGSYERALKTQRDASIDIKLLAQGLTVSGTLTLHTTQWYEPFVGLLKSQIDSGELTYMGMAFPIEFSGTVELVEFRP